MGNELQGIEYLQKLKEELTNLPKEVVIDILVKSNKKENVYDEVNPTLLR